MTSVTNQMTSVTNQLLVDDFSHESVDSVTSRPFPQDRDPFVIFDCVAHKLHKYEEALSQIALL